MRIITSLLLVFIIISCSKETETVKEEEKDSQFISYEPMVDSIKSKFTDLSEIDAKRLEKGIEQSLELWQAEDGKQEVFIDFAVQNFKKEGEELDSLFAKFQRNWEVIRGHFNKMMLDIKRPVALEWGDISQLDRMFDAYNPSAHLESDLYKNKIAFAVKLNFPHFTLEEKRENADDWSRKQWAYARAGDLFTSRVPSALLQKLSQTSSEADAYIYEYYIHMGNILDSNGETPFPDDMKLITHWNLRDELKAQYANDDDGRKKQEIIHWIMRRIITQEIPEIFINDTTYNWNPETNELFKDGEKIEFESEPNTRYQKILDQYHVSKQIDKYSPALSTYIERKFTGEMEMTIDEVEKLFVDFVNSPTAKKVGELIKTRLGRDLQPFDIWYDGFKARSSINEDELSKKTKRKYPNPEAVKKDLPTILTKLGWTRERANYISDRVEVDPSRGAGHAWGAEMKGVSARLRTRIAEDGMDYKGYNIAIHEFGHNVEQVLSLHDVDYYMLNGVPNTAFTEALAFIFQMRDLELLGINEKDKMRKNYYALDNFWSTYEIMGISLVDQKTWKWLYENPKASGEDLNKAVNKIAKDVWNKYYAPVFGVEDSNILGIYSHMIAYPLYLSAYPIGHLIEFQIEQFVEGKNLGNEFERMARIGSVTPNKWMREAVGSDISPKPLVDAAEEALSAVE